MKTKKKAKTSSRFTRGVKVGAKRRHGRKPAGGIKADEDVTRKLETLTTL
ncbi:MAG: hypothetical protein HYV14_09405 [Elusimicrobia bacterium]|nr:hypothetical protein [Elusimicrobiota bacterium]